jgi:thiamine biosynthesis lipoprotein
MVSSFGRRLCIAQYIQPDTAPRLLSVLLLFCAATISCSPRHPETRSFRSMGTRASVTVAGAYRDRLPQATEDVIAAFSRLEGELSNYQRDSEISRLAEAAGRSPLTLSDETLRVLELSKQYGELTQGAFDVTIAPLVRLWGFGGEARQNTPSPELTQEKLKLVDFRKIELKEGTAYLPAGMSVDLGGIGKGYAVDIAFEALRRSGVGAAMVDLGGNIRVLGQAEADENWTIGVRNPFDKERVLGKISLPDRMAVATSGNYERFVEMSGRRYSHIVDPRTGYPVEGMAGVTAVFQDAGGADALSTALFVLGMSRGCEVLQSLPGAEAMFIPDRDPIEIWLTPGMAKLFSPLPEFAASVRRLSLSCR